MDECKEYNFRIFYKKGSFWRNIVLRLVPRKVATKIVLSKVAEVYNHPLHHMYKVDILYNERTNKLGEKLPTYRIRLKVNTKIEFFIEG